MTAALEGGGGGGGQQHAPAAVYPRERPVTHCTVPLFGSYYTE